MNDVWRQIQQRQIDALHVKKSYASQIAADPTCLLMIYGLLSSATGTFPLATTNPATRVSETVFVCAKAVAF